MIIESLNQEVDSFQEDNSGLIDSLVLINSQIGCTDSLACNFDLFHLYDDGACEYPEQGYDCDGNLAQYQVGDLAEGGIVFYVEEGEEVAVLVVKLPMHAIGLILLVGGPFARVLDADGSGDDQHLGERVLLACRAR